MTQRACRFSKLFEICALAVLVALAPAATGFAQAQSPSKSKASSAAPAVTLPPVVTHPTSAAPRTVAESSEYTATSTCAEVRTFIRALQRLSPLVRVETMAVTAEGRDVPLLVVGRPAPAVPDALKGDPRLVVYIQANIHAGEVEGKEAALALIRDLVLDPKTPYLDRIVLLVAPLFNADGNDKMDPRNRPGQVGPEKGAGVRYNGLNMDLNRDAMKLESPEMQGLVKNVFGRWDPLLLVDCHTTDGSYHDETVTWSWPLCPNGDTSLLVYQRNTMMPAIGAALEKTYGVPNIPYGDPADMRDMSKGWRTFSHQPRYMTNYFGLRNRLSVLDENYNYADYKTRVIDCYRFLRSILDYAYLHSAEISRLAAEADRRTIERGLAPAETDTFGVEMENKPLPKPVTVRGYEVEIIPREGMWPEMKKTDRKKIYTMPYYADFVAKRSVRRTAAYLVSPPDASIAAKLAQHGIAIERLTEPEELEVEAFKLQELKGAERPFQGHRTNQVKGQPAVEKRAFPAGTLVVRTAQPLGLLAAYLLEPESDDGLLTWNYFDRYLAPQWSRGLGTCPVYKAVGTPLIVTEAVR